ncbi:pilus-related protein [Micromonas commoda]|uniref:Pilus-related protein n=1 Tax=Micromonas commoda (strain RCC299 / NOUM17 / CCMP2709) TaxID=296587 RepID=C1FDE7_MICCC|nr:pilus-related protein [Micromonas commoda]ACO68776.1 pilus-related protein [Micromonas commoda]|eukprot:XP_002507518.1 pilus-related protein [Micromonas commoda]
MRRVQGRVPLDENHLKSSSRRSRATQDYGGEVTVVEPASRHDSK